MQHALASDGREPSKLLIEAALDDPVLLDDRLVGCAQAAAERRRDAQRDLRLLPGQVQEPAALQAQEVAVGVRPHRRRPWLAGEERHLAEAVARSEDAEARLAGAVGDAGVDAERPASHDVQAVGRIPLPDHRLTCRDRQRLHVRRQPGQGDAVERREQVGAGK